MATVNTANLDIDLLSESEEVKQARALLASKIGEAAWQIPVNMVVNIANMVFGAGLGLASAKSGGDFKSGFEAGSQLIPSPPASDMTKRGLSNIGAGADYLNTPFRKTGEFVEKATGSPGLGTAAELASSFWGPTAFLKLLRGATRFGGAVGPHFGIDVRGQGDLLSKAVAGAGQAVRGRKFTPAFYGSGKGEKGASLVETGLRGVGSAIRSTLFPQASAILKKHGLTPTSIDRINKSREILNRGKETGWARKSDLKMPNAKETQHAEKVMLAELRKIFAMKLKSGEKVSPELWSIVEQYHPRLLEVKGLPSAQQLNHVLDEDIPDEMLDVLISAMPKSMVDDKRVNILSLGGNPSRTAMRGPESKKIASENPTELFVVGGRNTYGMIGDIWSRMKADERFYITSWNSSPTINWVKPGHRKYDDTGMDREFNADSVGEIMLAKTKSAEYLARNQNKVNVNIQSKNVDPKDVVINGDDYLMYKTVSRSDDPLLASVPASVLFNPRTGVSRILSFDELDIFEKGARTFTEMGFPKRFHTLNYGKYTYGDDLLEKAKLGKAETPVDWDAININIDAMMDAPVAGEYAQRLVRPMTVKATTEERKKREDSQARNIY